MRLLPFILLAAACTSTQSGAVIETRPVSTTTMSTEGMSTAGIRADDSPFARMIGSSFAKSWDVLPAVYQSLGITITKIDSVALVVRGQRLRSRQPFLGKQLSDLIDCGETTGIPNAMRYDITLQFLTQLHPQSDSTMVSTQVLATAKASGTAGDAMRCAPNGRIATGIAEAIARAVK